MLQLLIRVAAWTIGLLILTSSTSAGQTVDQADSTFFEAVLRGLLVVDVRPQLEISPVPFEVGGEFPGYIADSTLIPPRVAILRKFGMEPGGPVDVGECPGSLIPESPTHPACPDAWVTKMEIGLPRAVPRGGVPYWRRAGRQAGMRASVVIRVNFAHLAPHGAYMIDFDYYLDRDEFGWFVVARQPLTIIE